MICRPDRLLTGLLLMAVALAGPASARSAPDAGVENLADAPAWVDVGRERYRNGDHHGALAAARTAMRLAPDDSRALEFTAQITRDAKGPVAALPLFRRAVDAAPEDVNLLGQYAATLGDAGRHREMLAVARQMVAIDPAHPQAYFLQALLAARAGLDDLARRLLWRTEGAFDHTPAAIMLNGIIDYRAGHHANAIEHFADLRRIQKMNPAADYLFARALVANGEAKVAARLLRPLATRGDAPLYAMVLLGRAYEQTGQRERAAFWLDRAARRTEVSSVPVPAFAGEEDGQAQTDDVLMLRRMLARGSARQALEETRRLSSRHPGSIDYQTLLGDAELLAGSPQEALRQYRRVAKVRSNGPLIRRMVAALDRLGDTKGAHLVLEQHLSGNPRDSEAARMLARREALAGRDQQAAALLRHAARIGSGPRDPLLLAELARQEWRLGAGGAARRYGLVAQALYPAHVEIAALDSLIERNRTDPAALLAHR